MLGVKAITLGGPLLGLLILVADIGTFKVLAAEVVVIAGVLVPAIDVKTLQSAVVACMITGGWEGGPLVAPALPGFKPWTFWI